MQSFLLHTCFTFGPFLIITEGFEMAKYQHLLVCLPKRTTYLTGDGRCIIWQKEVQLFSSILAVFRNTASGVALPSN